MIYPPHMGLFLCVFVFFSVLGKLGKTVQGCSWHLRKKSVFMEHYYYGGLRQVVGNVLGYGLPSAGERGEDIQERRQDESLHVIIIDFFFWYTKMAVKPVI
ncbi:hypothetical protein EDB82DRAFT_313218 [Fusarium venenatum]|uniref:uncharacterized protein n=1 Tax=Fusarium venenatum TaxID=56646 RepID=UPI001D5EC266|nr:hypothetical protein EDB82DRAFT_313218 [Fusarium venenatum]